MRVDDGASGIDVVCAATMRPVSSKLQSFSVIAARTTAACHSKRHSEMAHPIEPMIAGAIEEFAAGRVDRVAKRIVLAENEVDRPIQWKVISAAM